MAAFFGFTTAEFVKHVTRFMPEAAPPSTRPTGTDRHMTRDELIDLTLVLAVLLVIWIVAAS
jgi:hypothetical protein